MEGAINQSCSSVFAPDDHNHGLHHCIVIVATVCKFETLCKYRVKKEKLFEHYKTCYERLLFATRYSETTQTICLFLLHPGMIVCVSNTIIQEPESHQLHTNSVIQPFRCDVQS
jgi:hypothetical protein